MLDTLNESRDLTTQMACQDELDGVLSKLVRVVMLSRLEASDQLELIEGIAHIRGHIHAETHAIRAEMLLRHN
jgi:hypothetical protein